MSRRARVFLTYAAANVRRLRLRSGLTQEGLAELAGLDHTYVQAVERVRTNFTVEVLVALADALQAEPRDLLRPAALTPPKAGRPLKIRRRVRPSSGGRPTM